VHANLLQLISHHDTESDLGVFCCNIVPTQGLW